MYAPAGRQFCGMNFIKKSLQSHRDGNVWVDLQM